MNLAFMPRTPMSMLSSILLACLLFLLGCADIVPSAQRSFTTAADAASALATAARMDDQKSLTAILGGAAERLIDSGDPVQDQTSRQTFAAAYDARHSLVPDGPGRMELRVGENDWPLPIPIVLANGRWHFDSDEGAEELVNRRIGKNELLAIRTLLSGVAAQRDYFARQKRASGRGIYTRQIISISGRRDGLYWEAEPGEPASPLGPLVDQARDEEGYPGPEAAGGQHFPYQGYFFRVLEAQGPSAPNGARAYLRDGRMSGGFAFLAWPAEYGSSGIMTFIVGPDGVPYQRDLGTGTEQAAAAIRSFDPDISWTRINIE